MFGLTFAFLVGIEPLGEGIVLKGSNIISTNINAETISGIHLLV